MSIVKALSPKVSIRIPPCGRSADEISAFYQVAKSLVGGQYGTPKCSVIGIPIQYSDPQKEKRVLQSLEGPIVFLFERALDLASAFSEAERFARAMGLNNDWVINYNGYKLSRSHNQYDMLGARETYLSLLSLNDREGDIWIDRPGGSDHSMVANALNVAGIRDRVASFGSQHFFGDRSMSVSPGQSFGDAMHYFYAASQD